ncbi:hypothetical protein Psta_1219 [Pirellula staleyi DSM 6068]|uniref:Uncharacterized protein n=1 Tax=Pirellula staleyi (strain ATCC 27377 / DSM 6068 / ICPB 4128) TaxID=530564 RepID=D2R970_PIRSD|nr:hypothetical protein Psta_1219 [Pirellula staleyi DSM 6068]
MMSTPGNFVGLEAIEKLIGNRGTGLPVGASAPKRKIGSSPWKSCPGRGESLVKLPSRVEIARRILGEEC